VLKAEPEASKAPKQEAKAEEKDEDPDHWTVVKGPTDGDVLVESKLGDDFVLINDADISTAIGEFVSRSVDKYPQVKDLDAKELSRLLDASFDKLAEPSTFGKIYSWGQFLYTTYGWGTCVIGLYHDPRLLTLAASGLYRASKWALVLLI